MEGAKVSVSDKMRDRGQTYDDFAKGACAKDLVNFIVFLLLEGGRLWEEGLLQ